VATMAGMEIRDSASVAAASFSSIVFMISSGLASSRHGRA
jgi:hypothetical protein